MGFSEMFFAALMDYNWQEYSQNMPASSFDNEKQRVRWMIKICRLELVVIFFLS